MVSFPWIPFRRSGNRKVFPLKPDGGFLRCSSGRDPRLTLWTGTPVATGRSYVLSLSLLTTKWVTPSRHPHSDRLQPQRYAAADRDQSHTLLKHALIWCKCKLSGSCYMITSSQLKFCVTIIKLFNRLPFGAHERKGSILLSRAYILQKAADIERNSL